MGFWRRAEGQANAHTGHTVHTVQFTWAATCGYPKTCRHLSPVAQGTQSAKFEEVAGVKAARNKSKRRVMQARRHAGKLILQPCVVWCVWLAANESECHRSTQARGSCSRTVVPSGIVSTAFAGLAVLVSVSPSIRGLPGTAPNREQSTIGQIRRGGVPALCAAATNGAGCLQ